MVHPVLIDDPQRHHALQLPHDRGGQRGLLLSVEVLHLAEEISLGLLLGQLGQLLVGVGPAALGIADVLKLGGQRQEVAAADVGLLAEGGVDVALHHQLHHMGDLALEILAVQHLAPLAVDHLTLGVHDVVVFEDVLSGLVVAALHGLLRVLDGAGEDLGVDGGVLVEAHGLHHALDPVGAEEAHDVVLHGQVEPGFAGVALTAGAAAELVVDPAGLMALGADDEQAAGSPDLLGLPAGLHLVGLIGLGISPPGLENGRVLGLGEGVGLDDQRFVHAALAEIVEGQILGVAAQHDIGTTACHVGGDGHGPQLAGLGHDLGFLLMVLGVEDIVGDTLFLEHFAQQLGLFNGNCAHQHRLALLVAFLDLADDGPELAGLGLVDHVGVVDSGHGLVGGNLDDVQVIDAQELLGLGQRRAGHAGELGIEPEEVLEGDGGQGLALVGDGDALLGLDGLMEALVIPAAVHQAAGELIDDDDLAVLDHVVDVPLHNAPGLHGLVDMVGQGGVVGVGEVLHLEERLGLGDALGRQGDGPGLLVHNIVAVVLVLLLLFIGGGEDQLFQPGDKEVGHLIELGGGLALAGDNQRRPGLVDEDGVHLVHDDEVVAPLDHLLLVDGHVVPEVVEAQLVVGAVGDVGGVGGAALGGGEAVDDQAHGEAHKPVDLAHPLGVTLGQVVVDGDDVDALAGEGVEVGGEDGHQSLAFTGLHLGDPALMEHDAADDLDPVGPHAQHPVGCLPAGGEGLGEDVVQSRALGQPVLEYLGLGLQVLVGELAVAVLQGHDLFHLGGKLLDLPLGAGAEELADESHICQTFLDGIKHLDYSTFIPLKKG